MRWQRCAYLRSLSISRFRDLCYFRCDNSNSNSAAPLHNSFSLLSVRQSHHSQEVYFITRLVYICHWDLWPTCEGTPITFIFSHKTCVAFSCYLCYVLGCLMGAATVTGSNNWAVTKAPCFALPPDLCRIHSWELNKRAEVRLISHRHPSWARKLQMVSAKWQYPLRSTGPSTVVLIAAGRDHQSTILINVHTCGKGRCLML